MSDGSVSVLLTFPSSAFLAISLASSAAALASDWVPYRKVDCSWSNRTGGNSIGSGKTGRTEAVADMVGSRMLPGIGLQRFL